MARVISTSLKTVKTKKVIKCQILELNRMIHLIYLISHEKDRLFAELLCLPYRTNVRLASSPRRPSTPSFPSSSRLEVWLEPGMLEYCVRQRALQSITCYILHWKVPMQKIWNKYSHGKGIARPQSQFPHSCVCEQFIYSHPSICLSCCRKICGLILGIYKFVTDTWIGDETETAQFPEKEYINGIFGAVCTNSRIPIVVFRNGGNARNQCKILVCFNSLTFIYGKPYLLGFLKCALQLRNIF